MKRILVILIALFLLIPSGQALTLNTVSENIILYNLDTHEVLYEKNANEQISIASMTKIMTAIVALEHIQNLEDKVTLTYQDFIGLKEANASVAGFRIGQKVTYRDLLYGLLLPSGADAALALTRTIAGGKEQFVQLMNEKAKNLGLKNTHFQNETGLDEEGHYSTVNDVATFLEYAFQNESFKEILTSSSYTISDQSFTVYSTIDKYKRKYGLKMDYLLGGKTGTTFDAGLCLASIAKKADVSYLLVTARAPYQEGPNHLYDAKTIYEYFMDHYGNQILLDKGKPLVTLKTLYSKEASITFYANESVLKYLPNEYSKEDVSIQYQGEKLITPSMKEGTKLGEAKVFYQDQELKSFDILLEKKLSFSFWKYIEYHKKILVGVLLIVMVILVFLFRRKSKKYKVQAL